MKRKKFKLKMCIGTSECFSVIFSATKLQRAVLTLRSVWAWGWCHTLKFYFRVFNSISKALSDELSCTGTGPVTKRNNFCDFLFATVGG